MTTHDAAVAFSALCAQDARLQSLVDRYEAGSDSLTEAEFNEMCSRMDRIYNSPFMQKNFIQTLREDD